MQQGMVYFPKDAVWRVHWLQSTFPNGTHDDQVDAWRIGLMMTEFSTYFEQEDHVPSWRDKLKYIAKGQA